jgi:hypothetical protein
MPFKNLGILGGGYSGGGINTLNDYLQSKYPGPHLWVCSGKYWRQRGLRGVGVDIRAEVLPTIQCDAEKLPFRDGTFRTVICDPPWDDQAAKRYSTNGVDTKRMLAEAGRVCRPHGIVVMAGYSYPWPSWTPSNFLNVGVHPVIPLAPMRIFCLFVWRKAESLEKWA